MWCEVTADRFVDLQPLLEFPNPEAEKQDKLKRAGIIRWAAYVEPTVRLWRDTLHVRRGYDVPMGAAWSFLPREDLPTSLELVQWLMPHQRQAVAALTRWRSGVVVAPCGAGKTQMGVALHRYSDSNLPTLVIVHTRDLATQWRERIKRLTFDLPSVPTGFDALCAAVNASMRRDKAVIIATVQTLAKAKAYLSGWQFGTVILDEAHHAPASTFQDVLGQVQCRYIYGLTATPERSDGWTPAMYAWLGPKRYEVKASDLQAIGLTVAPNIVLLRTGAYATTGDFTEACTQLANDQKRNELIARTVADHGEYPQLVLTSRVEHAEQLAKVIPNSIVVTGRSKLREKAFDDVRGKVVNVLIATQLADEGLDLPGLVAVHLTMPSRAEGRVVQRVGRVMRAAPGKGRPTVYDYIDDMGLFESQARSRMKAYRELGNVTFTRRGP
jgi:superfamily II DNA or RNA helicase